MQKLTVIGNLGSDAELRKESGQPFVSMSIAHTERRRDANGKEYETTQWISATLNGDGGNLLPYLKKGTRVYCYGDCTTKLFHSEKDRMMKAGLNLFIRNIELIGSMPDAVPRDLYDTNGIAHRIGKYFYCETAKGVTLYDRNGHPYIVTPDGWVTPVQPEQQDAPVTEGQNVDTTTQEIEVTSESVPRNSSQAADKPAGKRSNKKESTDENYSGF